MGPDIRVRMEPLYSEKKESAAAERIRRQLERILQKGCNAADINLAAISHYLGGEPIVPGYVVVLGKGECRPAYIERFSPWEKWLFTVDGLHKYVADIFPKEKLKFVLLPKRSAGDVAASCDAVVDRLLWQNLLREKIATVTWSFDEVIHLVQGMIDTDYTGARELHWKIAIAESALDEVMKPLKRLCHANTEMVRLVQEEEFEPERLHHSNAWRDSATFAIRVPIDDEPLRKRHKSDMLISFIATCNVVCHAFRKQY